MLVNNVIKVCVYIFLRQIRYILLVVHVSNFLTRAHVAYLIQSTAAYIREGSVAFLIMFYTDRLLLLVLLNNKTEVIVVAVALAVKQVISVFILFQ